MSSFNEDEKEAIEKIKILSIGDFITWFNTDGCVEMEIAAKTILNIIQKQEKIIDKMTDAIVGDKKILALMCKNIINKTEDECDKQNLLCDDCIKEYFKKKVEEEENG